MREAVTSHLVTARPDVPICPEWQKLVNTGQTLLIGLPACQHRRLIVTAFTGNKQLTLKRHKS